jgi:hypothetical protein
MLSLIVITNCTKLTLSLRVIDGSDNDNDGGHDDDNNNSAMKGA